MRQFIARLTGVQGDSTTQVVDLLVFIGYLAACVYAGGAAYESSYGESFGVRIRHEFTDSSLAVLFVTRVLIAHWYWLIALLYVPGFIFVYYVARYVWKPWIGYFSLSILLYVTFMACGMAGVAVGRTDAQYDKTEETTTRPVIKLVLDGKGANQYLDGRYRLLMEDERWFFIFEAQGISGSVIEVHAIDKNKVIRYEVTAK